MKFDLPAFSLDPAPLPHLRLSLFSFCSGPARSLKNFLHMEIDFLWCHALLMHAMCVCECVCVTVCVCLLVILLPNYFDSCQAHKNKSNSHLFNATAPSTLPRPLKWFSYILLIYIKSERERECEREACKTKQFICSVREQPLPLNITHTTRGTNCTRIDIFGTGFYADY